VLAVIHLEDGCGVEADGEDDEISRSLFGVHVGQPRSERDALDYRTKLCTTSTVTR
jgi:hypothetical protein